MIDGDGASLVGNGTQVKDTQLNGKNILTFNKSFFKKIIIICWKKIGDNQGDASLFFGKLGREC